jgi:polo-like kinase 1
MDASTAEPLIIEERITKVNGDFHIKRHARGKFLGKGGFAKVYIFTNLETNKTMAGKVMPKANLNRSRSRQKLMTEIRLHKSLHHQNIVKFEHVFEDGENVYIMLELCQNQSMNELLKRRKNLTEFEVQCYVIQIVDALKYLHSNRIIHRDLKLGNMFLNDKMQIKLGDFGLATKLEFDGEKKRTVCGTPNYIAPEILDGNVGHSYQVDVWALGVIIYTLIVGKPPFETTDIKLTYKKIKECDFSFPESALISESAKDIINKILVFQPEKRLTLDEILLHPFINHGGPIPQFMPVSTMACPPTSSYMKQFAASSTSQRIRIATDSDGETFDILKSPKGTFNLLSSARLTTGLKSPTGSDAPTFDFFRMTPKTPKLDFLGTDRFNLNVLNSVDRGSVLLSPKTPKLKTLLNSDNIPEVEAEHIEIKENISKKAKPVPEVPSELKVVKWYDYSAKYGLGYVLSNGAVGVFFNDGTKLIAPQAQKFQYITRRSSDKQDVAETYDWKEYPQDVHKKVLVHNRFKEHFESIIKNTKTEESYVYIKKWIKTKHAVFFRMNNRVLQVAFNDQTTLMINSDLRRITYLDGKGNSFASSVEKASSCEIKELTKRLKYAEEVLKHIWNAQTDAQSAVKKEINPEKVEKAVVQV